jgi:thiol-disulfide isomerase/thioredoxin
MNRFAKNMMSGDAQRIMRLVLIGIAVLAAAIAVAFGFLESYGELPGAPAATARRANDALPARTPVQPGFAFLDKPRPVPDLSFVDGAGHERSLSEFHGRPIILNIWATWCIPCRLEMPTLDRLQAMLGSSDAVVIPLSIDHQGLSAVTAFYQEIGIKSLGIYVDQSGAASSLLNVVGIPATLLVDRGGREIGRKLGPLAWDAPETVGLIRSRLDPRPLKRERRPSP